jgi:hypothetical protein
LMNWHRLLALAGPKAPVSGNGMNLDVHTIFGTNASSARHIRDSV